LVNIRIVRAITPETHLRRKRRELNQDKPLKKRLLVAFFVSNKFFRVFLYRFT
jgi:hypothetical protein